MTYDDALAYLESLTNYERVRDPEAMGRIRLERMQALCQRLGDPHRRFRSILVAGTNGKGSICAMAASILQQAGLRVGLYTSPHIEDLRERIRICAPAVDGQERAEASEEWISQDEFAALVTRLRPVIQELSDPALGGPPTYFEALTAVAFMHFVRCQVQIAVLEVGLGGRLDATNVVDPAVAVIAPIGLDHTDVLGADLASIAQEKAGIIKPGSVVVSGPQSPEAQRVIEAAAAQHGCRLLRYGQEMAAESIQQEETGIACSIRGSRGRHAGLVVPLMGRHQAENAAVAVTAVEWLTDRGVPYAAIRAGLQQVRWPGRVEVVRTEPLVVLDGAHNPSSAEVLRATVRAQWPGRPVHLLIGMSTDKSREAMAAVVGPMAQRIICTKSRHARACDPEALTAAFAGMAAEVLAIPDALDAYTYALNTVPEDAVIVITGSLFLVGELRGACAALGATVMGGV